MNKIIDAAINRSRAVLLILLLILISGSVAYKNIPKESRPDIQIPVVYVSMSHEGISPEDAERLLIRPMERELRNVEGLKEIRASASQGFASINLEFYAGYDIDKALTDVRDKVDLVKPDLPEDTDEPEIKEVNLGLMPVINVIVTANIPERELLKTARALKNKIEGLSSVLNVNIAGDREETIDIIIKPLVIESYGLTSEIIDLVKRNNILIAAGDIDSGKGEYQIKVPGLLETLRDIISLPIKVNKDAVVRLNDIATVKKGFKDPTSIARVNGKSALVLEVRKRLGENIIETIKKVRNVVEKERQYWPQGVEVFYTQDDSSRIINMVNDLENSIFLAIFLILIVIIWFIGIRSAGLIALSIPGSFLAGILILSFMGMTLNIVVLFSLILSIGMLVDSAIIVIEYANRRIIDGASYKEAYGEAAKRMAWPIIASTVTTLIAFTPLLSWPGISGQFMRYMPLTLITVLGSSMFMALIFMPTLGSIMGKADKYDDDAEQLIRTTESGNIEELQGFTGKYVRLLDSALSSSGKFSLSIISLLVIVIITFVNFGNGVRFFPDIEPDNSQIQIRARGNLSIKEKDKLVKEVEEKIFDMTDDVKVFYTRTGKAADGKASAEDVIGVINMEYQHWSKRRKSKQIIAEIKKRTSDLSGIIVEVQESKHGPSQGKAISIEVSSRNTELIAPTIEQILEGMKTIGGFVDVTDTRSVPAIEWQMDVNREQAARFGVNMSVIGNFVKLVSNGMRVSSYRPEDNDEEVDIMLRFPEDKRNLRELDRLRIITPNGIIPMSNFVTRRAKQRVGTIERASSFRIIKIEANPAPGVLPNKKVNEIKKWLTTANIDSDVNIKFKGEEEDKKESQTFLIGAFILALVGMSLVLLIQFNSIFHTFIIISAVFLSTVGVLLGLLITAQPFGIIMCGVGIISLAGIVVNNNIIFIDTYKHLKDEGLDTREALLRTGAQRMRPILLTAGTTVLGLFPMVVAMNINFVTREVTFGAPSTQWWQQLSTSIAGGLSFATILTLFFTPCLIYLGEKIKPRPMIRRRRFKQATGFPMTVKLD